MSSEQQAFNQRIIEEFRATREQPDGPFPGRLMMLLTAEEVVAYNMPGFSIGGSVVASYAVFSKQCGLYLLPGAIAEHADEIAAHGLKATKTGITFSPRKPIPDDLVERLAQTSRKHAKV